MTIQTTPTERKEMAYAIAELLGIRAEYLRTPTYGFRIGCVMVNRDGTTDCEDPDVLERLIPMLIEKSYLSEAPATEQEDIQEPAVAIDRINIYIPIEELTPNLMRNIVFMLYSKQRLINKALGSSLLYIEDGVIARLQEYVTDSTEELNSILQDFEALGHLEGIAFTSDKFTMSFPACQPDTGDLTIYAQLLNKLVDACKTTGRTRPKLMQLGDNEKYLMHSWLIHLGCGGPEFKELRRKMTSSLTGYCAFPDQRRADKHKAKYAEIRRIHREVNSDVQ